MNAFSTEGPEVAELFALVLNATDDLPPVSCDPMVEAATPEELEDALDETIDNFDLRARSMLLEPFHEVSAQQLASAVGPDLAPTGLQHARLQKAVIAAIRALGQALIKQDPSLAQPPHPRFRDLVIDPKVRANVRRTMIDLVAGLAAADALSRALRVGHGVERWKAERLLELVAKGNSSVHRWFAELAEEAAGHRAAPRNLAAEIKRFCDAAPADVELFPAKPLI